MDNGEKLVPASIDAEMKSAYIDYSMSVIVSRALPDVRDGLKPVHRRVLYGMHELGVRSNSAYKKSARIVGEVLGKYHPHGDNSIYDTMVRMAQEWNLRYLLVDGQGNYGSIDGDSPAAMRYTEARMRKISEALLSDIEKETVDFRLNFDDSLNEPEVLPSKIPNLLINGASGIAVGMATNMAPHNLNEVVDATISYIDNPMISIDELMGHIKGPDFPTSGIIYGYQGVRDAYHTGRGRVVIRAKIDHEQAQDKDCLIVTQLPYQVNKADLVAKTGKLINEKKIDGISLIRDESDRDGIRIVYFLKKGFNPNVVLNNLYKKTALQSSFSINNIALVEGRPKLLNLKNLIHYFVEHRHQVIVRRHEFELKKAEERAHILEGLIVASNHIDRVIELIRESENPDAARERLMQEFELSEVQAKAIVEMRLRQLTGLEQSKLHSEFDELTQRIERYKEILSSKDLRMDIVKEELIDTKERFGDLRRTEIDFQGGEFQIEDMIPNEQVVITVSNEGYIKRTLLENYRTQNRGGKGQKASDTKTEDFIEKIYVATTHQYMMFFTDYGKCYWLRVYQLPEGSKTSKGRPIQNLIKLEDGEKVQSIICAQNLKDKAYIDSHYVAMVTKKGIIKKTLLKNLSNIRTNGIKAMRMFPEDELLAAKLTNGKSQILLAKKSGRVIRFDESKVSPTSRHSRGVKGIKIDKVSDYLVGVVSVEHEQKDLLVISENGYGKRSAVEDYRLTNRGGKGVIGLKITKKTGDLIAILGVQETDQLMIINQSGIAIRTSLESIRVMGRSTQGVKIIELNDKDKIASVTKIEQGLLRQKEEETS
ncbi:MAG: DNA gyrase subunit A [Flavobacteriaceae bacterium]|nr:DNA gyrase subunit A [Flavobacteriaceae bacterium]MCY4267912.1 DNA gyrase subunit A [Flavobacteriaceae bacterium]